jgi:hypothetical protein
MKLKLSNQAMGAVMMALQNSIMEQTDIVPVLQDFDFAYDEDQGLVVTNPPKAKISEEIAAQFEAEADA